MHRLPRRRTPWPWLLLGLIALTVIAIVAIVLIRRATPELAAVAAADARTAEAGFTVVALDGGDGTTVGRAAAIEPAATDAGAIELTSDAAGSTAAADAGTAAALGSDAGDDELVIETATLEVVTRPAGARIQLADQPARVSPTVMTGVPVGRVTFTVGKDGYATLQRTITLAAGEHRTLELVLVHQAGPAPRQVGYLTVRTEPYSLVYLGQRLLGETPFAGVELPVGAHTLVFKHPRHKHVSRRVTIIAGKTAKLNIRLP